MTSAVPFAVSTCGPIDLIPACHVPVTHWKGDSAVIKVLVWQDDAHTVPADLSTATITAMLKETNLDVTPVATFDVTVGPDPANEVTLYISPEVSRDLPMSKMVWDMQIDWFSDGVIITTAVDGTWQEKQDVTW